MKTLLLATAAIELAAGMALAAAPSAVVSLLLGSPLNAPAATTLGRLTGAALLALGVACWFAQGDGQNRAARGLVAAMLLYNVAAVALFAFARIMQGLAGVALWPAFALHAVMAVWCIACLTHKPDVPR
jgi:hypothetical protein